MATVTAPTPTVVSQKSSHPFTCITCSIAFRSSELQRGHMRSDWHRYNLKRRVASLPPLSSEVFAEKVLSAQASSKAAADKASFEKHCQACSKTYFSENAFRNHLGSQRHRMMEATHGAAADDISVSSVVTSAVSLGGEPVVSEDIDDPAVAAEFQDVINGMKDAKLDEPPTYRRPSRPHHPADSGAPSLKSEGTETPSDAGTATSTAMPINRCLFCNYDSDDLVASLVHMSKTHGLFIPEQDYLDDLEGLVSYLQAKITENFECICCHKLKNTVPAVQTHMRDKSHCRIAFDTEEEQLEIGQFYDFRSTYSDEEEESDEESDERKPRGGKLGAARKSKMEQEAEDEDWEDDSDDDDDDDSDASEETSGSITPTKRNHRGNATAFEADGELFLPSGRTAGHRSGMKYYKQNLHRLQTDEEREEQKLLTEGAHGAEEPAENAETALVQRKAYEANRSQLVSRANGGTGMRGVTDQAKRAVKVQEKRERRSGEKAEQKRLWQMQRNRGKTGTGATGKRAIIHRDLFA